MKNIFKKNGHSKKNDKVDFTNVPKIEFEDFNLHLIIGQWLQVLPSSKELRCPGISCITHLNTDELIKSVDISKKDLDEVKYRLGRLLMDIGISKDQKCILTDFDAENLTFKLNLENKESYDITLRWGDLFDFCPEFRIKRGNTSETYTLSSEKPPKLYLNNYTLKTADGNTSLFRDFSSFNASYVWQNGENCLSISVKNPDAKYDWYSKFYLENESALEEYLLSLESPVDIVEVYKKLQKISLGGDISVYPEVKIRCFKKEKNKEIETDVIILESGVVEKIKKTQDGKTISVDGNGNWTFENSLVSIGKDEDKVRVSINSTSSDELLKIPPIESYTMASKEVENVQKLVRDLFK